jgi:hypothetical protein
MPVTTQIPTATFTLTPPTSPTPLRTSTNTIPPPPNPSIIPTPIGTPNTPTPNPQQVGTPQAPQPSITPLPISKITDKAPKLPKEQKAEVTIRHPDGTYELLLIDYSIKASTYLEPGDELIGVTPPTSLFGHTAPLPTEFPPSIPTSTPAPYPIPTR